MMGLINMKPSDLKIGDVFYECQSGFNIEARVTSTPESSTDGHEGRTHWKWTAENTQNDEVINYGLTEGMEHYGPRLYDSPQYCHMVDGNIVFNLIGSPDVAV